MAAPRKRNDVLAQWSRQTPITKVGIVFVFGALIGLVYWQFFLKDLQAEKESQEASRNSLLSTQASLRQRLQKLEELEARQKELSDEVAGLEFALPNEAEINSFLDHLQTKAGDASVSFKSWRQEAEKQAGKYIKVPVNVTVEGNFYQLMRYFYLLGPGDREEEDEAADPDEPQSFDRIITVENLSINESALQNDEILLTASFTAATFRQEAPPQPEQPAQPKKAAPTKKEPPKKTGPIKGGGPAGKRANRAVRETEEAMDKRKDAVKGGIDRATKPGANQ